MYEHLAPIIKKISKLKVESLPAPWALVSSISVGGLRSVGFDRNTDLLLIVSSQGRGVVDCLSGVKIARDEEEYYENEEHLEAKGIGLIENKIINMAGLFGGGLPTTTEDNWSLESVTINWPAKSILLVEPGSDLYGSIHNYPDKFSKIEEMDTIKAYGFSHTGKTLIIATSSDVTIYGR